MWLSRDPIAENGGINLYAYAANNPINFYDILGLSPGAGLNFASERYSDLTVSLGDFDGAKAGLDKAERIIDKEAKMGDELAKRKKPGFWKRCANRASSAWKTTKRALRWATGKPLGIYSSAKNTLEYGPSAATGGAAILESRRALDAALQGDFESADRHSSNARGLSNATDQLLDLAE